MPSRRNDPPWRAWYKTARWRALRGRVFLRDGYQCQCGCGRVEARSALLVADHKVPHRGDERLFWDEGNVQTLLKTCHDVLKQRQEQETVHQRGVWN